MIRDFGDTLDDRFKNAETITKLNRGSREIRKVLKRENLGESPKSIAELAKQDPILFGMYITLYNEGSKFNIQILVQQNYIESKLQRVIQPIRYLYLIWENQIRKVVQSFPVFANELVFCF